MSTIKITLARGDLEALLLTENREIKLEIGQQIADAFAAKYLKSVIHDAFAKKVQETAQSVAIEQWSKLTVLPSCSPAKALKDMIRSEMEERLKTYVEEQIHNGIEKAEKMLTEKFSPKKLGEFIEARVTANIDVEIKKGVRAAIERALKSQEK